MELGGAISLLSFVTYKPYGVSHFSKKTKTKSAFKKNFKVFFCFLIGWFVRFRVHFGCANAYGSNQT